ncbi:MAG: response regulator [Desulfobacterales bacterium]|nr:response regulator [Desulfobacterales bacterium]
METANAGIMAVDDTPANLRLLEQILKRGGCDVRLFPNGALALASARAEPPDLILLDIRMPDMNGYEVCERLKKDDLTRDIPVIFISALQETMDKVKAFSTGGVDYITKPFQEEEVLARVETHLTLRSLQKTLEKKNIGLEEKNVQLEEALDNVQTLQKALEEKNDRLGEKNVQLEEALANVRTLRGLLPICAKCKKIRDDEGYWNQIEGYIESHTDTQFTHSLCQECMDKLYGEQEWYTKKK